MGIVDLSFKVVDEAMWIRALVSNEKQSEE
jgi:hypothetical protein